MSLPYTFTQKTGETGSSFFANEVVDGAHVALTGFTGAGPQTSDATGTPNTSPLTVSNSSATTLLIPANAVNVNFIALTNTVNVSETSATVAANYFTIPTGTQVSVNVARCSTLYLKANTGASTLSFWFDVL